MYILDAHLQAVPIGVSGELYIGGAGLARGYFERPDLTAEKFIPNPFSADPGARLYRTGDVVRYTADRNIEFLGRMDQQVKIRGFRVELGEIEIVLGQYPGVRDAVVVVREDTPAERRLVAYVVAKQEPPPTADQLRNFLKRKLPEYMVPSTFVFLGALPLTPHGKVDRRALPEPDQERPEITHSYVAPRTPAEAAIAAIWSMVLKLERVSIRDNFFDLGGHSLLATQVISRVRAAFQMDLPLRTLFEAPTIEGLSTAILEKQAEELDEAELANILAELELLSKENIQCDPVEENKIGPIKGREEMEEREDNTIYKVVVNHEEQYSIWPADRENALGWRDAGRVGLKTECLAYVKEIWTDMRPLSLRQKMAEAKRKTGGRSQLI